MGKTDNLIILENGTIYDPYKNKKKAGSIFIEDGVVKEVGKVTAPDNARKINCAGKLIVPELIDIHAHFREPGRQRNLGNGGAGSNLWWVHTGMRNAQYRSAIRFTRGHSFYYRKVCRFARKDLSNWGHNIWAKGLGAY